jgi:hypothetical protein
MSTRFSIYCNSLENKEYLRKIIEASGAGKIVESKDLAHLPSQAVNGIDVVFLEYQENNPELDHWVEKIAVNPRSPAIFLYFREISTHNLWKALRLGAKECFTFPHPGGGFSTSGKASHGPDRPQERSEQTHPNHLFPRL